MAGSPHQFSAFARSVTTRSGDGASQLEAECALIEVSAPIESPLAGSTGESARSACHGPVASPMDDAWACRAAHVVRPVSMSWSPLAAVSVSTFLFANPPGQLTGPGNTVMLFTFVLRPRWLAMPVPVKSAVPVALLKAAVPE